MAEELTLRRSCAVAVSLVRSRRVNLARGSCLAKREVKATKDSRAKQINETLVVLLDNSRVIKQAFGLWKSGEVP